jgi:two-component system OmpR family sensor kinase
MSIRLKLTLWYTFVLAVLLITLGAAIYTILSNNLRANIDTQLTATADQILGASRVRQFSNLLQVTVPEELDIFRASGVGVEVLDNDGMIVNRSRNIGNFDQPFDRNALSLVTPQNSLTRDVRLGDARLRVLTAPIAVNDQRVGYLQVAASLDSVDESLRQLGIILLAGGAIAILAAALVGAFLARQALRPIARITQTASSIARAGKPDQRVPQPGHLDEVGRLAETFNLMLDRLEGLFNSQQRFIADISHELRTPLTTIRGNVDLLQRIGGADPASLEAIRGESDRMIRLVGDLLLLAQADAGLPVRQEALEVDRLAGEVVRQLQVIAGSVKVALYNETAGPLAVNGDPDRLRQLLLNLVDNAIKYTPANGQVTVRLSREEGWARIDVTDTGPGVPAEHLKPGPSGHPLIFERFYRVEKSRSRLALPNGAKRPGGGTGLGLSIAHWIAQSHNGRIDVWSELGKGTTFTVWLPLKKNGTTSTTINGALPLPAPPLESRPANAD